MGAEGKGWGRAAVSVARIAAPLGRSRWSSAYDKTRYGAHQPGAIKHGDTVSGLQQRCMGLNGVFGVAGAAGVITRMQCTEPVLASFWACLSNVSSSLEMHYDLPCSLPAVLVFVWQADEPFDVVCCSMFIAYCPRSFHLAV